MSDIKKIKNNYLNLVLKYGDDVRSSQFENDDAFLYRFKELIKIGNLESKKILDIGCGRGDLYFYLKNSEYKNKIEYMGIDIVEDIIKIAKQKYKFDSKARFETIDIFNDNSLIKESFDYVFMSAIFNNNIGNTDLYLKEIITKAFELCNTGLAFNFISTYVNFKDESMAYHNPNEVLNFCIKNLSKKVKINHHYWKCDTSVFVYK